MGTGQAETIGTYRYDAGGGTLELIEAKDIGR
jgi:hypothetical protein